MDISSDVLLCAAPPGEFTLWSRHRTTLSCQKFQESFMTYRNRLHPWCIIRLLPNFQRITVARFRRRNDAAQHLIVLRRLMPSATFIILFDAQTEATPLKYAECPLLKHLASSSQPELSSHHI
jgi:hypothetical protein